MEVITDLHIHSKYARATSKNLSFENLEKYGRMKGVGLMGTGDFQHPEHRIQIDAALTEDDKGILRTKTGYPFIWQTEISFMFTQAGKGRAIHLVIFAPNNNAADKITKYFESKGRVDYDGRPIFGMSVKQVVKDLKAIDDLIEIIPAHCLLPDEKVICDSKPKKISEIELGEKVLTHTGNYKKVKEVLKHHHKGKVYKIQPYYFREEGGINTTSEHPFLAIKTVKNCSFVGGLCKPNSIAKGHHKCTKKHYENYKPKWILAKDLEINDILLYPRIKRTKDLDNFKVSNVIESKDYKILGDYIIPKKGRQDKKINNIIKVNPDFCRLIGYYLAEGYIVKKSNSIQFAFAKHEENYINDVVKLMKESFGINLSKIRKVEGGCSLHFYSKVLVNLFDKLFYEKNRQKRAHSKKIPQWMLYLSKIKQVELFKGWWQGDAGVSNSEVLINQMKIICLEQLL